MSKEIVDGLTEDDLTEFLWDLVMTTPAYKEAYDRYVDELTRWVAIKIAEGGQPIELQFAFEYVAAVCKGDLNDNRIKFGKDSKDKRKKQKH